MLWRNTQGRHLVAAQFLLYPSIIIVIAALCWVYFLLFNLALVCGVIFLVTVVRVVFIFSVLILLSSGCYLF